MKKYSNNLIDTIEVKINENEHPQVFKAKMEELIESGCSEDEARKFINDSTFVLELYYSPFYGMFAVESDAVECADIYNPYNGEVLEENED